MDEKVSREKLNKLLEELAHITCKDGEPIKNLKDSDKERALELFEKIEDILRKSPEVQSSEDKRIIIPQSVLIYIARASLYMHAQTYFHIVQSVTNTFLGRVDLELNNYYQMIVDGINHLLTLDECKDFPGEFKPFNENIFPETGILKIGWKGFAPDCADFLSKAQKYFHDTPEPPENVITSPIYFKYLSQKHSAIIEKAHEYASKVKRLCDEHNKKETTPSKESVTPKHKNPVEANRNKKKTKKAEKSEKKFQPWKNSGEARFVLESARIRFFYNGDTKDLNLSHGSRTYKLLYLFVAKNPLPQSEIKELCRTKTRPSDLVKAANDTLNKKIAALKLPDVPRNVEFIKFDNGSKCYGLWPKFRC